MRNLAFALVGFAVVSHAGISIPKNVLRSDQVEAARAEAEKDKKGLAFVLTDPDTSCGLCIAASLAGVGEQRGNPVNPNSSRHTAVRAVRESVPSGGAGPG